MPKAARSPKPAVTRGHSLKPADHRLPDSEQAAAAFMATDLPWLARGAREALAATPEVHGRSDGQVPPPRAESGG
jgi:hypothetical protein